MSKLKIAVIGCGNIACGAHIPSYKKCADRAEIKYFCDIVQERAQKCVEDYGGGIAVTDYKEVLADEEIDGVSVCVPNAYHSVIAIDALNAGKHVLCEKPAARTYAEALEMQKAQKRTGKTLNIGVVTRFHLAVESVRARILAGELGEVYHVYAAFREYRSIPGIGGPFTNSAISGGGTLIDWGVHRIDQILYMTGDPEPTSVSAATFCKLGRDIPAYKYRSMWSSSTADMNGVYDVDDSCTALVRTTGPVITLMGAWAQNVDETEQYVDFMGTEAGIRLSYCGGYNMYSVKDGEFVKERFDFPGADMYKSEIEDFLNCIEHGGVSRADIGNAVKTSKILQGAYDSSASGREVVFDLEADKA